MAVEIINKPDESTVNDSKKFTGVIPYNVIAINPTKDQLHEIGLSFIKSEPNYQLEFETEDGKRKSTIVDVWLKALPTSKQQDLDMVTKLTFFISNDPFVSQNTGKTQYVNIYGRTAWAQSVDGLNGNQYFINEGSRPAHRGEEDLYKFLFAWLNMTYDVERKKFNPCRIDINKLITGDYSELQSLVTAAKPYVVKVLTGVRKLESDNGTVRWYPITYNKYFLKHNQRSTDTIEKYVNKDEYTAFKDADYFTYQIQEFDASTLPDEDKQDSQPSLSVGAGSDPF